MGESVSGNEQMQDTKWEHNPPTGCPFVIPSDRAHVESPLQVITRGPPSAALLQCDMGMASIFGPASAFLSGPRGF